MSKEVGAGGRFDIFLDSALCIADCKAIVLFATSKLELCQFFSCYNKYTYISYQ